MEPAGEGQRLVALFDEDDGRVRVAARRVCAQVCLRTLPSLLGLGFVGQVPDPQENLRSRRSRTKYFHSVRDFDSSSLLSPDYVRWYPPSHLIPRVQEHHILFVQVALVKVVHLGHPELACLIGALKEAGTVVDHLSLQPEGPDGALQYNRRTPSSTQ